jgi:hypothetical protein
MHCRTQRSIKGWMIIQTVTQVQLKETAVYISRGT